MSYLKDKIFLIDFGKHLRKIRKEHGFTQESLAFKVGIEISQISRIERGILNTSISTVYAIAQAIDIPVIELFDFEKGARKSSEVNEL